MEDKDIKIIKDLINDLKQQETITGYNAEIEIQALENLLQGYKQDEKVIDEMADFIFENVDTAKICGMINSNDCFIHSDNCNKCIIDYFRKKCE